MPKLTVAILPRLIVILVCVVRRCRGQSVPCMAGDSSSDIVPSYTTTTKSHYEPAFGPTPSAAQASFISSHPGTAYGGAGIGIINK